MDTKKINQLKNDHGVALVEFYADWCPHCQRMMPVVADVAALEEGRATVYQFEIDRNSDFASELDVESVPTFIIYKNGEEMWRGTGEMSGSVLAGKVGEAIG